MSDERRSSTLLMFLWKTAEVMARADALATHIEIDAQQRGGEGGRHGDE